MGPNDPDEVYDWQQDPGAFAPDPSSTVLLLGLLLLATLAITVTARSYLNV